MADLLENIKKAPQRIIYGLKVALLYKNPLKVISLALDQDPKKTVKLNLWGNTEFFTRKIMWDFFVINEVFIKKEYGILEKEKEPKTIIDVGAHIGSFCVFFAKKFPNAKIYSYEPMPDNFALLQKNLATNRLQNKVFPFNAAVVGKKTQEQIPLYLCEDNPACNSLDKEYAKEGSKEVFVRAISFAEIFSQNHIEQCDILKLDCENVELEIIKENKETFQKIKTVILEYHDPKKLLEIRSLLESYGFEFKLIPNNIIAFAKRK